MSDYQDKVNDTLAGALDEANQRIAEQEKERGEEKRRQAQGGVTPDQEEAYDS